MSSLCLRASVVSPASALADDANQHPEHLHVSLARVHHHRTASRPSPKKTHPTTAGVIRGGSFYEKNGLRSKFKTLEGTTAGPRQGFDGHPRAILPKEVKRTPVHPRISKGTKADPRTGFDSRPRVIESGMTRAGLTRSMPRERTLETPQDISKARPGNTMGSPRREASSRRLLPNGVGTWVLHGV